MRYTFHDKSEVKEKPKLDYKEDIIRMVVFTIIVILLIIFL